MNKIPPSQRHIKQCNQRDSQFELLRIIAQFLIVWHHMIYVFQPKYLQSNAFFTAVDIPLHIGVIIFVLLSGYFTIKATSKGFIKIFGFFVVYSLPVVYYIISNASDIGDIVRSCLFFSNSYFWYVKTYIYLFLFSPVVNLYLKEATAKQRWYIIAILAFIACYMPFVEGDASLEGGKNLINFIFIYVLGNQLFYYRDKLNQINIKVYALAYVLLNIALVSMQYIFFDGKIGMLIQKSAFPYCSPFIMINAILLFMCVSKLNIRSKTINYIAASTFSVYLIHGIKPYPSIWIKSMCSYLSENISSNLELLISYSIFAIVLYMACVLLDKMLSPLWRVIGKLGNKVYIKLGF